MQFPQVRGSRWFFRRPRKDDVCNIEIARRPVVRVRSRVELSADPERRFAYFVRRPGIADECRVEFPLENDDCKISEFRLKWMGRLPEHETGQHDERIRFRDKETILLQIVYFPLHLFDLVPQETLSLWSRCLGVVLGLKLLQTVFPFRNELARVGRLLWPPVAGVRLKVCGCAVD